MNGALVGFRGRGASGRAMALSRYLSDYPTARQLRDKSWVGEGDTIIRARIGDRPDRILYGARGTMAWQSEVEHLL